MLLELDAGWTGVENYRPVDYAFLFIAHGDDSGFMHTACAAKQGLQGSWTVGAMVTQSMEVFMGFQSKHVRHFREA